MDRIAYETEPELPYGDWVFNRVATDPGDVAGSVARAAVGSTYTLGLAALVVPTSSGRTARLVSAHRPQVPVLAVSPRLETVRRLNLLFGVQCAQSPTREDFHELLHDCARLAREHGIAASGELIGVTAGLPTRISGRTCSRCIGCRDSTQPLIAVTDVEASSRWYQRLLGCDSAHAVLTPPAARARTGHHQVRDESLVGHLDLDDVGRAAGVEVHRGRDQLVARSGGAEHVELHLDCGEVVTRREVAERLPRADRVGERHPGAAVDEAAGMQVAAIDDHAAAEVLVGDLDRLDAEVGREAVADSLADRLHGDAGIRLGHQPLKVEGPKSPNGSSRSRTACLNPSSRRGAGTRSPRAYGARSRRTRCPAPESCAAPARGRSS